MQKVWKKNTPKPGKSTREWRRNMAALRDIWKTYPRWRSRLGAMKWYPLVWFFLSQNIYGTGSGWTLREPGGGGALVNKGECQYRGGRKRFGNFWIFHQIFHRFTLNFSNTPFQVLKARNYVYKNVKTPNPSRVQPYTPLKITVFSNSDSTTTFYYISWKRRVISHWITAQKNCGKCESPRFIRSEEAISTSSGEYDACTWAFKADLKQVASCDNPMPAWISISLKKCFFFFQCWCDLINQIFLVSGCFIKKGFMQGYRNKLIS